MEPNDETKRLRWNAIWKIGSSLNPEFCEADDDHPINEVTKHLSIPDLERVASFLDQFPRIVEHSINGRTFYEFVGAADIDFDHAHDGLRMEIWKIRYRAILTTIVALALSA